MTDRSLRYCRATSHRSTPRTCHTLVVWPAAACAARRGCNVGVLRMFSDVKISGVSFGEETQNIAYINTVEVLILIHAVLTFPSIVSVDLSHTGAADRYNRWWITGRRFRRTQLLQPQQHSADGCVTRTVLPADAYGRQRCNVVLATCSVVYRWYMSWAVCS